MFQGLNSKILQFSSKSWIFRLLSGFAMQTVATLETLRFDNLALRSLPIDSEKQNYVRTVRGACFSCTQPTPVKNPRLVAYSKNSLNLLGLDEEAERPEFVEYFSGNAILPGSEPAAHCYCGHQFGYFSGQLGDGAAMYLGEVLNSKGERWEIQLKGAGLTPYSRQADGRKVLRSTIREFLCSEAMHHLGIPTTRAGSCITSDTKVQRDIFYNGNNILEQCAIVLRIAPTFIRFGSFEIFKPTDQYTGRHGPSVGRKEILVQLLDYTINTFYPEIAELYKDDDYHQKVKAFFTEVLKLTAHLVAQWQCVGFCHGVLNTDNMSIVGLTIDYGPFGFLDRYDPDHVCNASDDGGRYTFVKQPEICQWNLLKLAEALKPVLPLDESISLLEEVYTKEFNSAYLKKMRLKLGLLRQELESDSELIKELLSAMEFAGSDFTNTFRALCNVHPIDADRDEDIVELLFVQGSSLDDLIKSCSEAVDQRNYQMFLLLMRTNPEVLAQLGKGVEAVKRVMARMERAQELKKMNPDTKKEEDHKSWQHWLKKYRERLLLEGDWTDDDIEKRLIAMKSNNPSFILRNYIAQEAIDLAESGDYSAVRNILELLGTPYDDHPIGESGITRKSTGCASQVNEEMCLKIPDWAQALRVT